MRIKKYRFFAFCTDSNCFFRYFRIYLNIIIKGKKSLLRLCDIPLLAGSGALRRRVSEVVARMLPEGRARDLNQGLMDLGATVCMPHAADCPVCPMEAHCLSLRQGISMGRPLPRPRAEIRRIDAWGLVGFREGALWDAAVP